VAFAHALNWAALACAGISAAGVAWMLTRSLPVRLEKRLREAEMLATEGAGTAQSIKTHYAAFLEDADRILTSIERKRASISSAESKAAAREQQRAGAAGGGQNPGPGATRDELRQWAAQSGYLS